MGDIDISLEGQADVALDRVLAHRLPVEVDLADAGLVGATGLAFLARCADACSRAGLPCVVRHVTPHLVRVLGVLELDTVLSRVEHRPRVSS